MKNNWFKEIDKLKNEQINNQQLLKELNDKMIKKNDTIEKYKIIENNNNDKLRIENEIKSINEKNELLLKEIEQYKNTII